MCAHFSFGLILLSQHPGNRTTPLSPGVAACLERADFAETCAQKSVFPLLAKNSSEGGATQLSLPLGHLDWPVNCSKPLNDRHAHVSQLGVALHHSVFGDVCYGILASVQPLKPQSPGTKWPAWNSTDQFIAIQPCSMDIFTDLAQYPIHCEEPKTGSSPDS
jgi:hypothetical protein